MNREKHASTIVVIGSKFYQAVCSCGWSSTINFYEHVDLLRAMHVHAAISLAAYA